MTQQQIIVNQRRSLLIYAQRWGVTRACKAFGLSRTTFYKIKKDFLETGSLAPKIRRRPKMPNEIALSRKKLLLKLVQQHPSWGLDRYAYAFRQQGIQIGRNCIQSHLRRFNLNKRYKRLVYIETLKNDNKPVTEKALRTIKRTFNKIKIGQWPGHIVALDTFYVGCLKGVGRIYQLSGIDICSRFAWTKLYTSKEQVSSIDFVESTLIPKFYQNNVEIESVLTDNGSEFIGNKFQQMLFDYDIVHHRIPKGKPMMNGYCERFQRTVYEEFYQHTFRTRFFKSLEELQESLNKYLVYYNFERAHFGIQKDGAIPIDIFKSKHSFLQQRFQKLLT